MPGVTNVKGVGSGRLLEITENRAARTVTVPRPPGDWTSDEVRQKHVLSELLVDSTGSIDMAVNGSTTPVEFAVASTATEICWVTSIVFTIHSGNMNLAINEVRRFGDAAASPGLTNGLKLQARQNGGPADIFAEPVQNIAQFYRYADRITGITDAVSAGVDLLSVRIDLPVPVGLSPDSTDSLVVVVQDDLTALTLFEAQVLGWCETL